MALYSQPQQLNVPKQTSHPVDFVIVGAGLTGLSCAIALRRVGHRVQVLDRSPTLHMTAGGARVPPNMSKILYHWGLEEEVRKISFKSRAIHLLLCESGEHLGKHHWDEEMLKEARGDFVAVYQRDLRKLLYDTAIAKGANVRLNTPVKSVDPDSRTVTLMSGEVIRADIIVGADGVNGVTRPLLTDEPHGQRGALNMYCTTIPKEKILEDDDLKFFYTQKPAAMYSWWGDGRIVLTYPIAKTHDIGMYVYGPWDGQESTWDKTVSARGMHEILSNCEIRLRKLGRLAEPPTCVNSREYADLEEWVHESGRLVLIGEAAHPLPAGAIHMGAMGVEDGAVLAKLFSHLRTDDQIGSFLWAFQDLRQPRCAAVSKKETGDIHFMTFPPGEMQQYRDNAMRAKRDAGIDALASTNEHEESPEWEEIKEMFAYDAEDEADNWWVEWGLLRERARGVDTGFHMDEIVVAHEVSN
ncbi:FAD/NAD(P)-binding domain-containing protein [Pluteus cervinus]|uniref:FAD/NAD(P)-binding domain-containing protein n=1 Tax=Pluteus cervinus TaxID=181527 RepID=A0ACD3A764_9AGAR|nr:FAD/NAD(P)-binding domain-containing protein [Pluteus cervinus]